MPDGEDACHGDEGVAAAALVHVVGQVLLQEALQDGTCGWRREGHGKTAGKGMASVGNNEGGGMPECS